MVDGAEWQEPMNANRFMVKCLHKRSKLCASSPPEERNFISKLPDELLVEILCRLPNSKFAFQCKCVCKHWTTLISHPYFISRFIASKENEDRSSAIVARVHRTELTRATWKRMIMHLKDPVFNSHNFSFAPLPCLVGGDVTPRDLIVVGACNDLLLYCRKKLKDRFDYYICNVQTKQWLQLPSLFYHGRYFIGFICDPYDPYEGGHATCNFISKGACRFSIIVVPYTGKKASKMSAHLYSSNTSQWTKIVLSLPKRCRLRSRHGFVFDGMLHFRCMQGVIVGFDPYNIHDGIIQCHLIPMPAGFEYGQECTGVREGCLQMFEFDDFGNVHIWVLKDYKEGKWCLQHSIAITEFVPRDRCLADLIENNENFPLLGLGIGQHPINPDVIYVLGMGLVLLCNAEKRTMEVASRLPASKYLYPDFIHFQIMLPIWPTPLPTAL